MEGGKGEKRKGKGNVGDEGVLQQPTGLTTTAGRRCWRSRCAPLLARLEAPSAPRAPARPL
eukprot:361125-Chlamydomonas_euryale.AAC.4